MRGCFTVLGFILFTALPALAQKPMVYYYTATSERYFSDKEMDSVFFSTSREIFEYNGTPADIFEKRYASLKPILVGASRKDIVQSFKWVESTGSNMAAPKGSEKFESNKALYTEYLVKNINKAFNNNSNLRRYFGFSKSDRIVFFNSIVRVQKNGKLLVEENIRIYNGDGKSSFSYEETGPVNNEIKRGIVRAFPIYYYEQGSKLFRNTTFKLISVRRNGEPENYHTEKHENGILVYTGSQYVFLENGYYNYTITYETDHQLKFLKDYDELAWNVTGTGWNFRIDSAKCTIILPGRAGILSSACYTGSQGSKDQYCSFSTETRNDSTYVVFRTTRSLNAYQGITVASSWPKGIINPPGAGAQLGYMIWNNKAVFFLPLAALFSAIFCFFCWLKYGRDPNRGTVYPEYKPVPGYSPAAMGYIYEQKFDMRFTAATVVDAAVRNVIHIDVEKGGWLIKHNIYKIDRPMKQQKPKESNYEDFESDIKDLIGNSIEKGKYNANIGDLNKAVKDYCETNYKTKDGKKAGKTKGFFALNTSFTTIPILVCVAAAIWAFFGAVYPVVATKNFWQAGYYIGGIFLCWLVLKIFSRLLPAYNAEGRKLMDKIEGFRMFLSTADAKRFDAMAPPEKTLELYEKYLPFAIALDCEIAWGKQFEAILATAALNPETAAMASFSSHISRDSDSLGSSFASSFSGAISSASTPPSSSSGGGSSFGGGSSGGGGGGGGGGGW